MSDGPPTVLTRASPALVTAEPYPHIVLADAVDEGLCRELIRGFPPLPVITGGRKHASNERYSYPAVGATRDPRVSDTWRRFLEAHVSQAFLEQLLDVFGDSVRRLYPDFEHRFGRLSELRAGVRSRDDFDSADVLLDAQVCLNTPVVDRATSVRGPHVDVPNKLFAGLFYLRHPDDESRGGELAVYRFRGDPGGFRGQFIGGRYVEVVERVPYHANLLVLLVNSVRSLHGVEERSPSPHPRCFLNLLGEVREPLFDLDAHQQKDAPEGAGWSPTPPRDGRRRSAGNRLRRLWDRLRA